MIGLIGPKDSVDLALAVAEDESWGSQLIVRAYTHSREAAELARELDETCQVLLLTGRVPFELIDSASLDAEVHFISHSGADLYRCLARVLIDRDGKLPLVSLDSIEEAVAADAFADLDLPRPSTMPLPNEGARAFIDTDQIVQFHLDQINSGAAQIALTCLAEVRAQLDALGVPVWRVTHTKSTLRSALRNAVLSDELHRSRATQPAVALFRISSGERPGDVYDRESVRLQLQGALLHLARKSGGRLATIEADVFSITTTRGAIETAIERRRTGHASLLDAPKFDLPVIAGVGIGETYALAEEHARAALEFAQPGEAVPVVFPDGRVNTWDGVLHRQLETQDITDSYLKLGEKLNIGALAARRLIQALTKTDSDTLTARQLGEAYGVQTRSARRLLAALSEVGFAEEIGIRARPKAGRPQTLYRVNLRALVNELDGETS